MKTWKKRNLKKKSSLIKNKLKEDYMNGSKKTELSDSSNLDSNRTFLLNF